MPPSRQRRPVHFRGRTASKSCCASGSTPCTAAWSVHTGRSPRRSRATWPRVRNARNRVLNPLPRHPPAPRHPSAYGPGMPLFRIPLIATHPTKPSCRMGRIRHGGVLIVTMVLLQIGLRRKTPLRCCRCRCARGARVRGVGSPRRAQGKCASLQAAPLRHTLSPCRCRRGVTRGLFQTIRNDSGKRTAATRDDSPCRIFFARGRRAVARRLRCRLGAHRFPLRRRAKKA